MDRKCGLLTLWMISAEWMYCGEKRKDRWIHFNQIQRSMRSNNCNCRLNVWVKHTINHTRLSLKINVERVNYSQVKGKQYEQCTGSIDRSYIYINKRKINKIYSITVYCRYSDIVNNPKYSFKLLLTMSNYSKVTGA